MATVTLHDLLRHVCPICGFAKQPQYARCDACERDMVVEAKQVAPDRVAVACERLDKWEEA